MLYIKLIVLNKIDFLIIKGFCIGIGNDSIFLILIIVCVMNIKNIG